jgi:hypothetical protein
MKALSVITLAILLGPVSTAMANDGGKNHQDGGTGLSAVTVPSKLRSMWLAEDAFAKYLVQHHVVSRRVKR